MKSFGYHGRTVLARPASRSTLGSAAPFAIALVLAGSHALGCAAGANAVESDLALESTQKAAPGASEPAPPPPTPGRGTAAEPARQSQVEELELLVANAYKAGDLEGLAKLYEEDGAVLPEPGKVARGRSAIKSALAELMKKRLTATSKVKRVVAAGELALVVPEWRREATGPDGKREATGGTAAGVARRGADGIWRFVIDNPYGTALDPLDESTARQVEPRRADDPSRQSHAEEILVMFAEAFNAGNIEELADLYTEDSVMLPGPGAVVRGRPGIKAALAALAGTGRTAKSSLKRAIVAGDVALLIAAWSITGSGPDGNKVIMQGTSATVARRGGDGLWRLVIDNPLGTD